MAAATPASRPPPPQQTTTTSGSGITSSTTRPKLNTITSSRLLLFECQSLKTGKRCIDVCENRIQQEKKTSLTLSWPRSSIHPSEEKSRYEIQGRIPGPLSSLVPGMSSYQIQIIIGVQEGHVVLLNTAVHHIHQTGGWNSLNFHPKTLQKKPTLAEVDTCGCCKMVIVQCSDLNENRSRHRGSFRHHYFPLFSIEFYSVCKRFPIVPSWHGYEMTTPRPPGKLIGHPSDLKRSCQLNATLL